MIIISGPSLFAQCANATLYPAASVTPDAMGALTTITTCSYEQEHSDITGITAGATYEFTLSDGRYITVHQGSYNGTVLGQGFSPVTVTAITSSDLFPSWNTDSICGTAATCLTSTVRLFLNCIPPVASVQSIDDCTNNTFSVQVDVASLGDGASVNILHSVNGVASGTLPTVGLGTYLLGPFNIGALIDVTVEHDSVAACNIHFNGVVSLGTCPIIVPCGGANVNETYCYVNNDNQHWAYQSSGTQEIALQFAQGSIETATYDHLRIYSGTDNSTTPIYDHVGGMENLAGLTVFSNGPPHALYMEMTSDVSVCCGTGNETQWNWTVTCIDCTSPTATYNMIPDCRHHDYTVAVDVISTGSSSVVRLANSWTGDTLNVSTGITTIGPIPVDSTVTVTVLNAINPFCYATSPSLVFTTDSCITTACSTTQVSYCYSNAEVAWFSYQSGNANPISIHFNDAPMSANDFVRIYNGPDAMAQLVYQGSQGGQLAGLQVGSSNLGNALCLQVISDAAGSCSTGQTGEMHWSVGCGLVGIAEVDAMDFSMYPNPTDRNLYLRLPQNANGVMRVDVYDVTGRAVLREQFSAVGNSVSNFDLNDLRSGNYTVVLTTNDRVKVQLVQVMH